jgi:environmental stress-induced protein Ves
VIERVVRRSDWRPQPWKNGGGVTHEVWRDGLGPDGRAPAGEAAIAPFGVRVSCAEVASDGPFSSFPGIDRTILLMEGEGFVLRRDDGLRVRVTEVGAPFRFRGEEQWDCQLVAGRVLDLNLMVARERASAELEVVRLAPGEALTVPSQVRALVLALDGPLAVEDAAPGRTTLGRWDAVVGSGPLTLRAAEAGSAVSAVVVRIAVAPPT